MDTYILIKTWIHIPKFHWIQSQHLSTKLIDHDHSQNTMLELMGYRGSEPHFFYLTLLLLYTTLNTSKDPESKKVWQELQILYLENASTVTVSCNGNRLYLT